MGRHLLFSARKQRMHRTQKRATAITPTNLSGLALWLDFTDATTLFQDTLAATPVAANNDPIGRVNDKSSNANNFTQGTAGQRPLWQSDGNGATFDGSNDVLVGGTTGLTIDTKTVIIAWTPVAFQSSTRVAFGSGNNRFWYIGHGSGAASARASWFSGTPAQLSQTANSAFTAGLHNVYVTQWSVSGSNVSVSQRSAGTLLNTTAYTDGYGTVTATSFLVGALTSAGASAVSAKIRHVLVYNRVLTPLELAGIETYLTPP